MPDQPSPTPDAVAPTASARSARLIPLLLVGAMLLPTTACTPEHMIDLINAERTAAGVGQLTPDASLAASCQSWAEHLAALSPPQLIHQNLRALGLGTAGENLALNVDVDAAHNALMNSPGHRTNILNRRYTKVGVGIANIQGGVWDGYIIVCELFQG